MDNSKYAEMFIEEARELILQLSATLISLEKKEYDENCINETYRIVHTLKGTANIVGATEIGELAHKMEDVLGFYRERRLTFDGEVIDVLLRAVDTIEKMVNEFADGKIKTSADELIAELSKFVENCGRTTKPIEEDTEGEDGSDIYEEELSEIEKTKVIEAISEDRNVFALKVNFAKDLKFKEGRAFQLLRNLSTIGNVIYSSPENVTDDVLKFKVIVSTKSKGVELESIAMEVTGITNAVAEPIIVCNSKNIETESKVMKTQNGISESKPTEINNLSRDVARADTIRVKSKLLDHLLNLVGEIMISNIRLNQIALELKNKELKQVIKNNIRLMNLLQDTVLQMRLVPIETIFKRYPKMVRDMAKETGKEIEFIMVGNEIEIDRSLLDSIGDSLVHLLRNAVDHGIEHDREKIGKPKKGVVKLSALQEKNSIVITVEDDGRGIDIKKIKEKAVEKGLISKDESERIDDKTALWLAFHPGISTSTTVTEYSGRGVGLDVVKTKVESLGGSIKVETKPGLGTKFIIKLPPSMSIIPAMLVEINGECYAIPLENVKETTKIACDKIIEYDKNRMFKLRDEVLPLVNIHEEFGGKPIDTKELNVVIVEKDDMRAGLVVSRFIGQQQIVVKSLSKDIQNKYFSGATILGDGKVSLIVDVGAIL